MQPLQAHLSRLGSRLSFAEAASELWHLKGVGVSAATARRRTEADGATYAASRTRRRGGCWRRLPHRRPDRPCSK